MNEKVTLDYSKANAFVSEHEMKYMSKLAEDAKKELLAGTGAGNDFLGWIDLPENYDKEEFNGLTVCELILSRISQKAAWAISAT